MAVKTSKEVTVARLLVMLLPPNVMVMLDSFSFLCVEIAARRRGAQFFDRFVPTSTRASSEARTLLHRVILRLGLPISSLSAAAMIGWPFICSNAAVLSEKIHVIQ